MHRQLPAILIWLSNVLLPTVASRAGEETEGMKLIEELKLMATEARAPVSTEPLHLEDRDNQLRMIEAAGIYCRKHKGELKETFPEFFKSQLLIFAGPPGAYDVPLGQEDWCLVFRKPHGNGNDPMELLLLTLPKANAPALKTDKAKQEYIPSVSSYGCKSIEERGTAWPSHGGNCFAVVTLDQGWPHGSYPWYAQEIVVYRIGLRSLKRIESTTTWLHSVNFNGALLDRRVWPDEPGVSSGQKK